GGPNSCVSCACAAGRGAQATANTATHAQHSAEFREGRTIMISLLIERRSGLLGSDASVRIVRPRAMRKCRSLDSSAAILLARGERVGARGTGGGGERSQTMAKYKIAWMPGDGIGKDVMDATKIVLDAMKFDAEYQHVDIGWDFWCKEGNPLPDRSIKALQGC